MGGSVTLTPKGRRALRHRHKLKLTLRVVSCLPRSGLRLMSVLAALTLTAILLTAPAAGAAQGEFGFASFESPVTDQTGAIETQAGAHPYEITTSFSLPIGPNGLPPGDLKDLNVELPAGFVGNPTAAAKCTVAQLDVNRCSPAAQVGVVSAQVSNVGFESVPLYNMTSPTGRPAMLAANVVFLNLYIEASVRTGDDYGLTASVRNLTSDYSLDSSTVTIWGVPADSSHDAERLCEDGSKGCAAGIPPKPFLTDPTSCVGVQTITARMDSWQSQGAWAEAKALPFGEGVTGCGGLNFDPQITARPTASAADSPSGLTVDLHVPQNENPDGLAEADLKNVAVTLPEGVTVNPAAAGGLEGCSPAQVELKGPEPAHCPDASKIGMVEVETPLLEHVLPGAVYVARQSENPFGSLLAIYIAVDDPRTGVVVKLAGKVSPDPQTGRLTTTFEDDPQLPFEDLRLTLFGGPLGPLRTPTSCGTFTTTTDLTPWTSPAGADVTPADRFFSITSGPGGAPCGPQGFAPSLTAGTTNNQAGGFSPFTLTLSRQDGEQTLSTVVTKMPPGLAGMLSKVALCDEVQANVGSCPATSQIGHVTASAGAGPDPLFIPQAGKPQDPVYLTGPYKGAPFGLSIVVPAEAGPFNLDEGGHPVVVRARIEIDPHTAQVSVLSDPMPTILQGIPLDLRTVNVTIDREGFIFNPTDCKPLSVGGTITSTQGSSTAVSSRFQAANCAGLPFKPSFSVLTHAAHSRANGEYLHVVVRSGAGQANIARVHVALPKQLPSRLSTLKLACSEAQFAANPAGCPAGSFVGTAAARTPVLPVPLTGPAIFVSHGGAAFPDLDVVLQGDGVTVILTGNTFINKAGITTSTFATVPDVPVRRFDLLLPAGPHSALSGNGNLCKGKLLMPTTIAGQSGAVVTRKTRIAVSGCPKHRKARKARHRRGG